MTPQHIYVGGEHFANLKLLQFGFQLMKSVHALQPARPLTRDVSVCPASS